MTGSVCIRRAVESDCATICAIDVRSRRWGYRNLLPNDALARLSPEEREPTWRQALSPTSTHRVWIAERESRGEGFNAWGPPRDADVHQLTAELYALYLEQDAAGTGIAHLLLGAALCEMREHGYERAVLWVLEANLRARRFYERSGWAHDGMWKIINRCGVDLKSIRYAILVP